LKRVIPIKIFPLKHYNQSGSLKPPLFFYISLLFLARTWGVLAISVVSRQTGNDILRIFYADKLHFYYGLLSGSLALLLFILSGRNHEKFPRLSSCWRKSYPLLILNIIIDFILQLCFLSMVNFQYSITASIQLVLVIWVFLYAIKSTHLTTSFKY